MTGGNHHHAVPYVLDGGEGEILGGPLGTLTVKASGPAVDVATATIRAGAEPPPQLEPDADTALYVLEGELTVCAGGELLPAAGGAFVFVPRGVPYELRVDAGAARVLLLYAPWGVLGAYGEVARQRGSAAPAATRRAPLPSDPTT